MQERRSTTLSLTVALNPVETTLARGIWVVVTLLALVSAVMGAPHRVAELSQPCKPGETCLSDQLSEAEFEAFQKLGGNVEAVLWYLEGATAVVVLISFVAAWLLFWRQRLHWIGVVASLFLVVTATQMTFNRAALGRAVPAFLPLVESFAWLSDGLVAALFLLFPSGRFVPRWTAPLLALSVTASALIHFTGSPLQQTQANLLLLAVIVLVGVGVQIYRYRQLATALERQQMKWVFLALSIQAAVFSLSTGVLLVSPQFESPLAAPALRVALFHLYLATFALIPISLLLSILRHRLWEVDLLIHRSLTYGILTVVLFLMFVGSVAGLQALSRALLGASHNASVFGTSMLAAGALFMPLRQKLLRFVDQRCFGIAIDHRRKAEEPIKDDLSRELSDGSVFRQYCDWELVGSGGMAQVFRARHRTSGDLVAIKVLRLSDASPEAIHRFERETRILAMLEHPNIARLLEANHSSDSLRVLVMEFVAGGDLSQRLKNDSPLTIDETTAVLKDVARALDYAHNRGIIHRDLKPSNILLDRADDGRLHAVLTDFGIAKDLAATQLTATKVIGTVTHMSPEQIRHPSQVDHRSDIYALGVLAFQLFTGQVPFSGHGTTGTLIAHLQQPAPDPRRFVPDLPEHIVGAIWSALAKRPAARPSSAGEFVQQVLGMGSKAPTLIG